MRTYTELNFCNHKFPQNSLHVLSHPLRVTAMRLIQNLQFFRYEIYSSKYKGKNYIDLPIRYYYRFQQCIFEFFTILTKFFYLRVAVYVTIQVYFRILIYIYIKVNLFIKTIICVQVSNVLASKYATANNMRGVSLSNPPVICYSVIQ